MLHIEKDMFKSGHLVSMQSGRYSLKGFWVRLEDPPKEMEEFSLEKDQDK